MLHQNGEESPVIYVAGVFTSRMDAEKSFPDLQRLGIDRKNINLLTSEFAGDEVSRLPGAQQGEQPGIVKALGAVTGGSIGLGVGEAIASFLVPGVGPVLVIGLAAGAIAGGVAGTTIAGIFENRIFGGIPQDELFVYEDALRQGRTVLLVSTEDQTQAEAARGIMEDAGAETIDRAREMWWIGLRDAEKERYEAKGGQFDRDERAFRCGFEAALDARNREKSYSELSEHYQGTDGHEAFRRGYERGQAYSKSIRKRVDDRYRVAKV
jgi:hypothetical protein